MILAPDETRRRLDVVTVGEVMALHLAEPCVPLAQARTFTRTLAGAEFNVAVGLARLARRTALIGRVGADSAGNAAVATLRAEGVDAQAITFDDEHPTGLLVRDCHPRRAISVEYHRRGSAGSRIGPEHVDPELVASARVLFVSGITPLLSPTARAAQERCVAIARERGTTVVFDPNVRRKLATPARARRVLSPFAASADVVLTGLDEAQLVTSRPSRDTAAAWFLEHGARLVVVKDGAAGSWATDGRDTWTQPALPVPVRDPVGAGDGYDAGLLDALLDDTPIERALYQAAAVAALVVEVAGDVEGLPTRAELDTFVRTGWVDR